MPVDGVREPLLNSDEKCRELFGRFDVDKRGILSREGVRSFINDTFVANGVECLGELDFDTVIDKVFDRRSQDDKMTYSEFENDFAPGVGKEDGGKSKEALGSLSVDQKTQGHQDSTTSINKGGRWYRFKKFCRKYSSEIFWLTLYFQLMVAVFVAKASQFAIDPAVGHCIQAAKGFAQICLVNTVFVLLPMCRNLVTGLRTLSLVTTYLPVDHHIEFHKICGVVLLLAALGHTAAWVAIVIYARNAPISLWEQSSCCHLTFVRDENFLQFTQRVPIWTGIRMLLCAAIAASMCVSKIRRGSFNLFWLAHMLFIPFLVLMAFHSFAGWMAAPKHITGSCLL